MAFLLMTSSHFALAGSGSEPNITYRVSTSEVRLTFFATDDTGKSIQNIRKGDFAIVDGDMIVRNFRSLSRSEETTLNIVILVDASASVAPRLQPMMNEVLRLISQKPANGKLSVWSFAGLGANLLCSRECDSPQATQELLAMPAAGATPLYDALAGASEFLCSRPAPDARPVLVLFSDGDDTISKITANDALQSLLSCGALLYAVDVNAIASGAHRDTSGYGSATLRQLAEATGGRYISTREQAANPLQSALDDLRATYVVTYQAPRTTPGFHSLRILPQTNLHLQFHCRNGYFSRTGVP